MNKHQEKKYVLYGSVKIIKDFLYIFRDIPVSKLVLSSFIPGMPSRYHGFLWEDIHTIDKDLNGEIVVCMKPGEARDAVIDRLKKRFINKNVVPCEKIFLDYDESFTIPDGYKLYVWGTGKNARQLMEADGLPQAPEAFIDSFKSNKMFYRYPVLKPEEIVDWNKAFVVVAVTESHAIETDLSSYGLCKGQDFVNSTAVLYNPYKMLCEVFFSEDGYDFACDTMLNHLEILTDGATRVCCTSFMKVNQANFLEADFGEHWAGKKDILHRILALSTQNRSYVYCDKTMCPLFDGRKNLGTVDENIAMVEYHEIEPYPRVVACAFDNTCNLACETCRTNLQVVKGKKQELVNRIAEKIKRELLPHTQFLVMAGNGEVLLSPAYRSIWQSEAAIYPRFFRLLSNGTLFNESMWKEFSRGKEHTYVMLTVSIDAATKKTYESIRQFGNFDQLQHNMIFAGRLRAEGSLAYFRMNFVVQRKNMKEMAAFAAWGKRIGADKVFFTKIQNWGTYENSDFQQNISVMEKDGVTPIPELKAIIESPDMHDPIVDLGTIRYAHQPNNDEYIKNYYMWELEKDVPGLFDDKQIL
jgi:MoaA/NifB/PqqE/SkfB family radical SAM enzyme